MHTCCISHPDLIWLRYDVYKNRGLYVIVNVSRRPELAETAAGMKIETSHQLSTPVAVEQPGLLAAPGQWVLRMSTTRANGVAGLIADVGISVVLLGAGLWQSHTRPLATLATMLLGLLLFSFIEYAFHRWLFHGAPKIMEQGHRKHHELPDGYDALPFFLPPLVLLAIGGILNLVLPAQFALLLAGSLAAGYAAYGLGHAAIHNMRFQNQLSRRWAAIHHIHHYHPDKNFGVTTPLWDMLLGTRYVSASKTHEPRAPVAETCDG